jgi:integrase
MKLDSGLSPATIHSVHAVLRGSLKQAVRSKLLSYNAAEAVELPKLIRHEVKTLSVKEAKRFLQAAHGERLEALYVLAPAFAGILSRMRSNTVRCVLACTVLVAVRLQ